MTKMMSKRGARSANDEACPFVRLANQPLAMRERHNATRTRRISALRASSAIIGPP